MIKLLGVDESKITTIDVQGVFLHFYKIDIAKMPIVSFDVPLNKKYLT